MMLGDKMFEDLGFDKEVDYPNIVFKRTTPHQEETIVRNKPYIIKYDYVDLVVFNVRERTIQVNTCDGYGQKDKYTIENFSRPLELGVFKAIYKKSEEIIWEDI